MIDQSSINLLDLIGSTTTLKWAASTDGGEYRGPCPMCGGTKRLKVQPNYPGGGRWFCRDCTPKWTDAIAFWRKLHPGITFNEAREQLGLQTDSNTRFSRPSHRKHLAQSSTDLHLSQRVVSPPTVAWQRAAHAFTERCSSLLWSQEGAEGQEYLASKRGLLDREVLEYARIGYNPRPYNGRWGGEDVYIPRGITIPWIIDHQIWGVNARDMNWKESDTHKYRRARGSQNAIYGIQEVYLNSTVVMVETELDVLVLRQLLHRVEPSIVPIATGSTGWGRPVQWLARVALANHVFVAFDLESEPKQIESVERAAAWWLKALAPKASRLLPTQHDITDMLLAGDDILAWIKQALQ